MGCCTTCRKTPCGCNAYGNATPVPYYQEVPCCPEDNCQKIYITQSAIGVQIQSSWNVPQCGGAAVLSVPGLVNIPVGEFLHHPTFGYFEVVSFDAINQQISIQNPCFTDNALPGSEIPACTTFTIGPPPCCEDVGQSGIFVAIDFTAPDDGDCLDITLTAVEGLIAGNNVEINSGIYLLDEIKADNVVTICNEGEGIIPGTPVIAKDIAGNYVVPVIQLSINACTQDITSAGTVLVCNDGSAQPLTGAVVGYVLKLTNTTTGAAAYAALPPELDISSGVIENTSANNTGTLDGIAGPVTINSNNAQVIINNPSATTSEKIHYTVDAYLVGEASNGLTAGGTFTLSLNVDTGGGPIVVRIVARPYFTGTDDDYDYADQVTYHGILTVAASGSVTITASGTILTGSQVGDAPNLNISTFQVKISAIGVAV